MDILYDAMLMKNPGHLIITKIRFSNKHLVQIILVASVGMCRYQFLFITVEEADGAFVINDRVSGHYEVGQLVSLCVAGKRLEQVLQQWISHWLASPVLCFNLIQGTTKWHGSFPQYNLFREGVVAIAISQIIPPILFGTLNKSSLYRIVVQIEQNGTGFLIPIFGYTLIRMFKQ